MGVVLMNYPLNLAVIFVSIELLGLHPFVGGLLANVVSPVVNYVLHTRVVFAQRTT